jgi:hypothetical protein
MDSSHHSKDRCALESLDHLNKKICLMWGSPELDIFISRLIMDSRDGARKGLPMEVGADLLFLAKTNKIIRAIDLARGQQVPFRDALRLVDEGDQKRLESDTLDNPLVSRDTIVRTRPAVEERRTGQERRQTTRRTGGPLTLLGHLIFKLATSKLTIFLVVFVLVLKLMWPLFFKAPPPP